MKREETGSERVEVSPNAAAWLAWLMARDLERWSPKRRTRLSREDAAQLYERFLQFLPESQN